MRQTYQFWFKAKSNEINTINNIQNILDKNIYQYVELFIVPNTLQYIKERQKLKCNFILHTPHDEYGCNISRSKIDKKTLSYIEESITYAKKLNANSIIMHSWDWWKIENLIKNIRKINNEKIIIENTFYRNEEGFRVLKWVVTKYEDIKLLKENNIRFCLDFSHHIINCKFNSRDYKKEFLNILKLEPYMFHLSDWIIESWIDKHLSIWTWNFDFKFFLKNIPNNSKITIETPFKNKLRINDINILKKNIEYLKS